MKEREHFQIESDGACVEQRVAFLHSFHTIHVEIQRKSQSNIIDGKLNACCFAEMRTNALDYKVLNWWKINQQGQYEEEDYWCANHP